MREKFVRSTLKTIMASDLLSSRHSILAICAGLPEARLFSELKFSEVTICNIDESANAKDFAPYKFVCGDSQNLPFESESFDFVFVSDGLHHCLSPHAALAEMTRIAKKGVIVFEARDSLLMRIAHSLKLLNSYECSAVLGNHGTHGGLDNGPIPNYVYRWTEREFEKTVKTCEPRGPFSFKYFYGLNLTYENLRSTAPFSYWVFRIGEPVLKLATLALRRQRNSFGMIAIKPKIPEQLWPWLKYENSEVVFDMDAQNKS